MDLLTSIYMFMKRLFLKMFSLVTFALVAVSFLSIGAEAAVSNWQKGVSVYPHSASDFTSMSFKQTVLNLKDMGADTVTFIIPIYQTNETSSDIQSGGDTPSNEALAEGISYVHDQGMKVVLKPHLEILSSWGWRAYIKAQDRDAWYANYGAMLNNLADIGNQNDVEGIVIGTELIGMASEFANQDNTARWNKIISDLRQRYSGFLTYDANWSWGNPQFEHEVHSIGFWSALDYIGVSAYYPLAQNSVDPSVDVLIDSWKYWDESQLRGISERWGKPLLFSEIGYKSVNGAHNAPCCTAPENYDGDAQVRLYEALFKYWSNSPHMAGLYLWYWDVNPDYGGFGNRDYTAQGKPAYNVIKTWFGGNSGTGSGTGIGGTGTGTGTGTSTGTTTNPGTTTGTTTNTTTGTSTSTSTDPVDTTDNEDDGDDNDADDDNGSVFSGNWSINATPVVPFKRI